MGEEANKQAIIIKVLEKQPSERTDVEVASCIVALRSLADVIRRLDHATIATLIENCELEKYSRNDLLIKQDDPADSCFLIVSGRLSVFEAKGPAQLSKLGRAIRVRQLKPVFDEAAEDELAAELIPIRTNLSRASLGDANRQSVSVQARRSLNMGQAERRETLSQIDEKLDERRNTLDRRLSLRFSVSETDSRSYLGTHLANVGSGALIGEISLLQGRNRVASVIADTRVVHVIRIGSELFHSDLKRVIHEDYSKKRDFIANFPIFESWRPAERELITMAFEVQTFEFGESIVRQDDDFSALYFVVEGEVEVRMNPTAHEARYRAEIRECSEMLKMIDHKVDLIRSTVAHNYRKPEPVPTERLDVGKLPISSMDKFVTVCTLQPISVIGDIEAMLDFKKYVQTAVCRKRTIALRIVKKYYDRAVKRNESTAFKMLDLLKSKLWMRLRNDSLATDLPLLRYAQLKIYLLAQQLQYQLYQKEQAAAVPTYLRSYISKAARNEVQRDYVTKAKITPLDKGDVVFPTEYISEKLGDWSKLAGMNRELMPIGKIVSTALQKYRRSNRKPNFDKK